VSFEIQRVLTVGQQLVKFVTTRRCQVQHDGSPAVLVPRSMLVIAAEDKCNKSDMAEADNDLVKKHVGSNIAMYGRLGYIVLIGTAGSDMKVNAMTVTPGSSLQELFPAMEVNH